MATQHTNKHMDVDYKNIQSLKKHLMESGRLIPSRMTGVSAAKQRAITKAVKIARYLALIPYTDSQQQEH